MNQADLEIKIDLIKKACKATDLQAFDWDKLLFVSGQQDSNPRYRMTRTSVQQTGGFSHSPTSPWYCNRIKLIPEFQFSVAILFKTYHTFCLCECGCKDRTSFCFRKPNGIKKGSILKFFLDGKPSLLILSSLDDRVFFTILFIKSQA